MGSLDQADDLELLRCGVSRALSPFGVALEPVACSHLTPDHAFFQQPVLQHLFGKRFLEVILAIVRRRLPLDWTERYGTTPVLIETFVETPRYTGAVYRASGWTRVGTTQGRGRYDRHTKRAQPKKDIWLRPLRKDWRRTLNR